METFDSILTSVLQCIEGKSAEEVDRLLADKLSKMGGSADDAKLLSDTMSMLKNFEERKVSLRQAKEEGKSREVWMQEQLYHSATEHDMPADKISDFVESVNEKVEEAFKNEVEKGE